MPTANTYAHSTYPRMYVMKTKSGGCVGFLFVRDFLSKCRKTENSKMVRIALEILVS